MLILKKDCIEWERGDVKGSEFTTLQRSEITDFKHGMDWTVWYKLVVGREFSLSLKGANNNEIKIRFNSLFGINKHYLKMYSDIVDDIWKLYYSGIVNDHVDRLKQDGLISVAGVTLRHDEIELNDGKPLSWDVVSMKEYGSYFALFDKNDSTHYRTFRFNEYGAEMLWSLVRLHNKS